MSDNEVSQEQLKQLLEQRNNELVVINSVQAGLAGGLEIQAIYELVGNQIDRPIGNGVNCFYPV